VIHIAFRNPEPGAEPGGAELRIGKVLIDTRHDGMQARRLLTLRPNGSFLETVHVVDAGGAATDFVHEGTWLYDGTNLKREEGAVGFASLRGGTVAGDHDVIFAGPEERLILSHRAENRMIFARGALAAAKFLVGQPAGLYTMRDVVGAGAA